MRRTRALLHSVLLVLTLLGATGATPRSTTSSLSRPAPILAGVATDNHGHVYVADIKAGRVYVLSDTLQLLAIWTVPRPRGPYSVHLAGLAADHLGSLYATDLNDRVFKLSPRGIVQGMWGSPGTGAAQFRQPWGIAVGPAGAILVSDGFNHRIQTFSPSGHLLRHWLLYSPHDSPGGPCGLQYLAIDGRGRVYVTDNCYDRLFKLSSSGKGLQTWGQERGTIRFSGVAGVAVGPAGNVFVTETFRVLKFAPNGRLLDSFRKTGFPGYPFSPAGIAVGAGGVIYVADPENYRVFKLSPSGKTLAVRCLRPLGCRGSYAPSLPISSDKIQS